MKRLLSLLLLLAGIVAAAEPEGRGASTQIDALLAKDWQQHSLQGNAPASDEIFVRRIHLDLVGRISTHQETVSFLSATDKDKRAQLITAVCLCAIKALPLQTLKS